MAPHLRRAGKGARAKRTAEQKRARRAAVGKVLLLVLIFAVLAVPAVFVNTLLGYLPALFYLFVLLASYVYGRLSARFIEFDELIDLTTCTRGSVSELLVRVQNRSALFIPKTVLEFSVNNNLGEENAVRQTALTLPPFHTEDFHLDMNFAHIGEYSVGLHRLVVCDPLALFKQVIPIDSYETVLVTPQVRRMDDIALSDAELELNIETLKSSVADGVDYNSVRDYQYVDPMKHVHWKLSSRVEGLLTKVFERQSNPSLDVYVDFGANSAYSAEQLLDINDMMVETALALSTVAFDNGLDTRLLFLKDDEVTQFSLNYGFDVRALVRALPRMGSGGAVRFDEMLLNRGASLYSAANVAVCSSEFSADTSSAAERVHMSGRNVLAFAFVPHGVDAHEERLLQARLGTLEQAGVHHTLVRADDEGVAL